MVLFFLVLVLSFLRLVRFAFVIFVLSWSRLVVLHLDWSCRIVSLVLYLSCVVLSCPCLCPCFVFSALCCLSVALRYVFVVSGRFVDMFLVVLGRLGGRRWPFGVVSGPS